MRRALVVAVGVVVAGAAAACRGGDRPSDAPAPQDGPAPAVWRGPAFTVGVVQMKSLPPQWVAHAGVTVPTGGHVLRLDDVRHYEGTLRLRVTLEQPGREELVTQATERLEVRHGTGTRPIARVEVWARAVRRADAVPAPYGLAATGP